MFLLNSTFKKTKLTHQSKDTIKVISCYTLFSVNKHFISGPDITASKEAMQVMQVKSMFLTISMLF